MKRYVVRIVVSYNNIHTQEKDGKPYHVKNGFTCKAQVHGFRELLHTMAEKVLYTHIYNIHIHKYTNTYVTLVAYLASGLCFCWWLHDDNAVEGFHGLALMYCDKRTDLGYVCKSNMGICHNSLTLIELPSLEPWFHLEGPMLYEHGCAGSLCGCECHPRGTKDVGKAARKKIKERIPSQTVLHQHRFF